LFAALLRDRPGRVTIVAMLHAVSARSLRRFGLRMFATGMLVASITAVVLVIERVPHGSAAPASVPPPPAPEPWGAHTAGYRPIAGSVATALRSFRVKLKGALAHPAAAYGGTHSIRLRYGAHSPYGVFLLTAWTRPHSLGVRAVRALGTRCATCASHRRVALGTGVRGSLRLGIGAVSTLTWREHGREFEVRGPSNTFSAKAALGAARAVARANA
jgi:hypothetical protein